MSVAGYKILAIVKSMIVCFVMCNGEMQIFQSIWLMVGYWEDSDDKC